MEVAKGTPKEAKDQETHDLAPTAIGLLTRQPLFTQQEEKFACGFLMDGGLPCPKTDGREMCCGWDNFPYCVTGIKHFSTVDITGYACGDTQANYPVYDRGDPALTAVEDVSSTAIESNLPVVTNTATVTRDPTTSTDGHHLPTINVSNLLPVTQTVLITGSQSQSQAAATETNGYKHVSGPPVGAIVGGAVGGFALLTLVAFGIWYARFLSRRAAADSAQDNIRLHRLAQASVTRPVEPVRVEYHYPASPRSRATDVPAPEYAWAESPEPVAGSSSRGHGKL
ncbi:hypothetical protein FALBO_5452 [Fusarium albosuccineum]|uniref:Uncharacterized protein n=1 Tax=Fusarium albosuccineum TaxID=1237068 RepID=A0A8H4P9T2_9HYPO|nr:hypothetical protein FALBO_5452 [Fusarium albosuccineum]